MAKTLVTAPTAITPEGTALMTGTLVVWRKGTMMDYLYALPLAHEVAIEAGDRMSFSPEPLPAGLAEVVL